MKWIVVIVHLIALFESKKLTIEENEQRLKECGLTTTNKIFRGAKTTVDQAPWALFVGSSVSSCSGTLISPRHVLSATHCIANHSDIEWTKSRINFEFDRELCTENENYIVTEVKASKVYVMNRNYTEIGRAKFIFLLKFCRRITDKEAFQIQYPDDFMIIELAEDVEYTTNVQPACIADDIEDNPPETIARFFGYGDDPPPGVVKTPENSKKGTDRPLLTQEIRILPVNVEGTLNRMDPRLFKARSQSMKSITCPGDSGGGAIRVINGRNTVIGVTSQSTCVSLNREENGHEIYGAVGFYSEEICELTGVCNLDSDENSSHSRFEIFDLITLTLITFWFVLQ
ncbi:hypothetical protein GCK72_002954 [Caenorhabditis remanei]|uniref:Peptidase S1 domain-containing protein n=1 Tax=Caenorhabditis remanei TaxID=31234 RepID=A0A6A5HTR8_CAERE|nr:hypothetical protein GCK72_002954 [Caenorhabditis remanei]KAF1771129.1 hypothetical protein GCK72_002954 [Caenorhabditis remanei]